MTETTLDAQIEAPPPPEHSRAKLVREEEKKDDGIVGFLLFAGRIIHAVGLFNTGGASIPRAIGIVLTWLGYLFAAVVLLLYAIA